MNTTGHVSASVWTEELGDLVTEVSDAITEDAVRQGSEPEAARAAFIAAMVAECLELGDDPSRLASAIWGPLTDPRLGITLGRA